MIRGYRFFNTEDFAAYLAVETAATQTKPSFAG